MKMESAQKQRQAPADLDGCLVHSIDPDRVERGRRLLLDDEQYFHLAEMFRALADATRAKIVYSLLHQELCTCDLAVIVKVSDAAVSQHLRVLRRLWLVKCRREGRVVYYSLDDAHVRTLLDVALSHFEHSDEASTEASSSLHPVGQRGSVPLERSSRTPEMKGR